MTRFWKTFGLTSVLLLAGCGAETTEQVSAPASQSDSRATSEPEPVDASDVTAEAERRVERVSQSENGQANQGTQMAEPDAAGEPLATADPPAAPSPMTSDTESGQEKRSAVQTGDSPNQRRPSLASFRENQGEENVVTIRIVNANDIRPGVLATSLATALGTQKRLATKPGDRAMIAIRYSGAIDDVAAKIDWGKVVSTNETTREIRVDAAKE